MSPTCTMVLLKLHCEVMEATLSALVAKVSGGRDGGSPTRSTEAPAEARTESQGPKPPQEKLSFHRPLGGANTASVEGVDPKESKKTFVDVRKILEFLVSHHA